MAITAHQKLQLKKLLSDLRSHKAPHTEFVTVYVPAGYDLTKIIQHLAEEQGTASNIKSATTRKNVQGALEKMIQHLRTIGSTPVNGLAIFSGNVAAGEGKQDMRIWSFEPPVPLNIRIYRCDKNFVTDIIEEMLVEHNVYGLVVLDRRDANIALLKGKTIVPLKKTHSEVPGKFKAGGQSAARFARLREGAIKDHFKKIAEYMKEQLLPLGNNLKGIIIGGPGTTVNDFMNKDYLTGDIKKKIIGTKDLSYTGDFGLQELLDRAQDLLAEEEITHEKNIVQAFLKQMLDNMKKITYGEKETLRALEMNAVDTLLLSESLSENKIFELESKAEEGGSKVHIISTETREGVQIRDLGGVVAILRFEIE
ncbi:peptide chain release factor 1 [Candidatus Woesearchaeota archaeon CG10_big_fil_rev_8_21_14_0_10_36_11]|nr:MAG: peptide chain release factor 1 [Candidatus Woesearchaeota archaeon CG10_big_fil_rev_8_21_14_0_10_36_11]